ncbi:MAG: hypothetical protein AAFN04_04130 [Pseudomonadota bacterium]
MSVSQTFAAKDVYYSALLGGVAGYLGFVALVASSVAIGSGQWGEVISVVIVGLLMGILPATLLCALVVAPVGAFIAVAALGWLPESRWHGAITGVLTAIAIIVALIIFGGGEWREAPDAGAVVFLSAALVIAAGTGWVTQRAFLPLTVRDLELKR